MKRIAIAAVLALAAIGVVGCKSINAPLPPNAINATDSGVNHTLQAAHAGAKQFNDDVQAGKFTPTLAEKAAYDSVVNALNVADPLYQQWHKALVANPDAGEPQQLINAVVVVTANINTVLSAIGKVN
jgi:opacity protein-like surface antigen